MRRSEIVALRLDDIQRVPEGMRVTIRKSKGDQEAKGVEIAIPEGRRLRPVGYLEEWLAAGAVTDGYLFRRISNNGKRVTPKPMCDRSLALVVKARVAVAGLDPKDFSGHSLRAGFLTSAARSGASVFAMQAQSRHKSLDVLSGYVRSAKLFEDHAGKGFL
jgi:integrase